MGEEIREARITSGLSQRMVGRLVGISHAHVSRIERGLVTGVSIDVLSKMLSVVGLELSVRAYPSGLPVRDAGHLALIERLRAVLPAGVRMRTEVPLRNDPAGRAWDVTVEPAGQPVRMELETRLRDVQALERRIALKAASDGPGRVVLVVADTRTNRRILAAHRGHLRERFPLGTREILAALRAGRCPSENGIVVL
jgi:transcriptional regulator with XRE-family HTH domain